MHWHIKDLEQYQRDYKSAQDNPEIFWAEVAKTFSWKKEWNSVLNGTIKDKNIEWFQGGQLNITENCLDRHLEERGDKTALIFEPNSPDAAALKYTYKQLHNEVCIAANMLKELGVEKGDRVCLYMSMVPELLISVLACARIGAIHSVVFGGFSAKALADRIDDSTSKLLITNDGGLRGDKIIPLKEISDKALELSQTKSVQKMLVHRRAQTSVNMVEGRDVWWHELKPNVSNVHTAETMDSEDPLFILYTSGSTGKPKGIKHTTAGYMIWAAYTFKNVFQVEERDTYWCTADIGWITGHTYITYGPLLNGATTMMFEGVPTWPKSSRFWEIIEKHTVTHFYTAPTAIRALMACDRYEIDAYKMKSLKVLGSVGEPINDEAWHWYDENVGAKGLPIVDSWWQTETGGIMISPLANITKTIPCFATKPLPGIVPVLMNVNGREINQVEAEGNLCIKQPWPGMLRGVWNDEKRYEETYLSAYPGYYFTGDGCRRDHNRNHRITGRVDDVINVSGHRIGTAEVEDAIDLHPNIIEAAVVGYPHDIKGQGIYAFIIADQNLKTEETREEINRLITEHIGPIAKPDQVQIVSGLPKTRSGKIMRRILRKLAAGEDNFGDTSTLLDPSVVESIREGKAL